MEIQLLIPVIATLVGGLLTYLGVHSTQRLTEARERRRYLNEKFERAYLLAQTLYDRHRAEIEKLEASESISARNWMENRRHPGEVMAELRMIVQIYAPTLDSVLTQVAVHHRVLKDEFRAVDAEIKQGTSTFELRQELASKLYLELEALGKELNATKRAIAREGRNTLGMKNSVVAV
jgi:hypothetical protein